MFIIPKIVSTTGRSNNFVDTITKIINEDQIEVPISIFKAPTSATSAKPEAYVPQLVGLGPVHYSRRELQHMQMYKVMEAKRIHNGFKSGLKFDKVAEILDQIAGVSIRASYNIYFDMEDDVLACVMAVDGLFLFHLLCCCRNRISKEILIKSSLSHVVNS
ncbi:hypothetical protein TIFTF001_044715 [Ficus carica]|nr:hypothetical protein TIFTF001_044715 [Ficus carica]